MIFVPPSPPTQEGGMSPSSRYIQSSVLQNLPRAQKQAQHHFAFSVGAWCSWLRFKVLYMSPSPEFKLRHLPQE